MRKPFDSFLGFFRKPTPGAIPEEIDKLTRDLESLSRLLANPELRILLDHLCDDSRNLFKRKVRGVNARAIAAQLDQIGYATLRLVDAQQLRASTQEIQRLYAHLMATAPDYAALVRELCQLEISRQATQSNT